MSIIYILGKKVNAQNQKDVGAENLTELFDEVKKIISQVNILFWLNWELKTEIFNFNFQTFFYLKND